MAAPSRAPEPSVANFRSYPLLPAPFSPVPGMDRNVIEYQPPSAQQNQSQIANLSQTAANDVLTRLQALPIRDVEATLSKQFRKSDPDCSLLSYLRAPGDGITQAQAAAHVLEELADGIEDVSTTTSLVVRYVQAHRLWTDHPNPAINSLETLLGTVDGIQYVQAGTVIGTSSQLMRARAIRLIEKHWGTDWFDKIPTDMKDPDWSTAADCSHQLLRLIAASAKRGIDLATARSAWAQSIRQRRDERARKELRMRCPRSPFIIPDDVRSLSQIDEPHLQGRRTGEMIYPDEPAEDQLRVELVTPGSKRSAADARATSTYAPAQRKRQKRRQRDPHLIASARGVSDRNGDWRVSDDGKWKQRRDGNQIIRIPLTGSDGSQSQNLHSPSESRDISPHATDGIVRSRVRSTDEVMCHGPSIAAKLHRFVETLGVRTEDGSAAAGLASNCCAHCRAKVAMLDGIIANATLIVGAFENLTDHQITDAGSGESQHADSVPSTPRLPRNYRWWLPIDGESDGE